MTNRYALADYQLVIRVPDGIEGIGGTEIVIGGPGDSNFSGTEGDYKGFIGQISVSRKSDAWETEGDRTGSWVHNQNLDKTGTCQIDITQISAAIIKLSQLCSIYEKVQTDSTLAARNLEGLTLTVQAAGSSNSMPVATCEDCLIQKHPDQVLGETAEKQSWIFTCGRISFYN